MKLYITNKKILDEQAYAVSPESHGKSFFYFHLWLILNHKKQPWLILKGEYVLCSITTFSSVLVLVLIECLLVAMISKHSEQNESPICMELTLKHLKYVLICQILGDVKRSHITSQIRWPWSRDIKEVKGWVMWLFGEEHSKSRESQCWGPGAGKYWTRHRQ